MITGDCVLCVKYKVEIEDIIKKIPSCTCEDQEIDPQALQDIKPDII